jgi:ADP-ribosyl-[dinitrogen reductase] hydrolase
MLDNTLLNRAKGCLVGAAVGDALGAPGEFELREYFDDHPLTEMIGGGPFNWAPGQVTDDTAMMLCIAESFAELERLDLSDIAGRFVCWLDSNPPDIGDQTREALRFVKETGEPFGGVIVYERNPEAASNGSVMRTAPVGLMFLDDDETRAQAAQAISSITHHHPLCRLGCEVVSHIIADLVRGNDLHETFDTRLSKSTGADCFDQRLAPRKQIKSDGDALHTVQAAVWAVAHSLSFEEALAIAVNLGGDTDSVGAVAGGIAGAHHGLYSLSGIPDRWLSMIRRGRLPDELPEILCDLARQIVRERE